MKQNDLNILKWYDSVEKQDHRKHWSFNNIFKLPYELDMLPPFQVDHEYGDPIGVSEVTELKLVDFDQGTEIDILSNANQTGLEVYRDTENNIDKVIYPSSLPLLLSNISIGAFYLKMTITSLNTETIYSEVFVMCEDLSSMIKIEYWHQEDFLYTGGRIRYNFPYKQRLYICSDIAKPSYEYEERVITREGEKLPVQQISFKLHTFLMFAPEYLCDAIRAIRLHDHCEINYAGYDFDVNEFLMGSPVWQSRANLAQVECEFRTDTIIVSNGRAYNNVDYEETPGLCIDVDVNSVARIVENDDDFVNEEYTPFGGGPKVSFVEGDLVLIEIAGELKLYEYTSGSYSIYIDVEPVLYNENTNEYFILDIPNSKYHPPLITNVTSGLVEGIAFENTIVEIYGRAGSSGLGDLLITLFSNDFNASGGSVSTVGYNEILIRSKSSVCASFADSEWFVINGIGIGINWAIGSTNTIT